MAFKSIALVASGLMPSVTAASVYVPRFTKYPGYAGDLEVVGSVTIHETPGDNSTAMQTLTWSLSGLDTHCVAHAGDNITNGCGIHVHEGTSCDAHADVGGHFYSSDLVSDPWAPVVYVASAKASSNEIAGVQVVTGLSNEDITGRVLVVHALDSGARIACGIIGAETGAGQSLYIASFAPYPGYSGSLRVTGTMTVVGSSGTDTTAAQILTWSLAGLDTACVANAGDNVTNGCGIHVHTGTSCGSHAGVGGHYYSAALGSDPWAPVVYVASADGLSKGLDLTEVVTGLSNGDITGRVMVVHALDSGARIACGVIGMRKPKDDFLASAHAWRSALSFSVFVISACMVIFS